MQWEMAVAFHTEWQKQSHPQLHELTGGFGCYHVGCSTREHTSSCTSSFVNYTKAIHLLISINSNFLYLTFWLELQGKQYKGLVLSSLYPTDLRQPASTSSNCLLLSVWFVRGAFFMHIHGGIVGIAVIGIPVLMRKVGFLIPCCCISSSQNIILIITTLS